MKQDMQRRLPASVLALLVALPASQLAMAQVATDASQASQAASQTSGRQTKSLSDVVNSIRDLRRIRPISAQGVRADVVASALAAATDNKDNKEVAVPWSQAMPGGSPLNDSTRQPYQVMQTQLDNGKLQITYQPWWEDGTDGKDLQRTRTEIPVTLPNGKQKPFHWVRNGKVLLSLGTSAFTITEYRPSFSLNFRNRHAASPQSAEAFELKQGQVLPFNQVLHQWTGPGPYQSLQLMVLNGEQENQFRVCFNINVVLTRSLVCNTWQVPHSWNYAHTLRYVGPYLLEGSRGDADLWYFRYQP